MPPLARWRDGDGDRGTALRTAPSLGVFDKATCQALAAVLRKHVEIADLANATPFDIEHGRDGDNGLSSFAVNRKRAPTEGVGEHSIEILRNVRKRHGEFFLAEQPRQQSIAISLVPTVTIWISLGKLSPRGKYDWPLRRMADCLNAVTVGIQHESAVIVGVIFGPRPWRTIVTPASGERRFVKGVHRLTIGSAEAEMRAGNWGFDLGFIGDRKFDTKRARRSTIIGAATLAEVDNAYKSERA
jgi:hypothetical protein